MDLQSDMAKTTMSKARSGLIMSQPFWGSLALHLKLVENPGIPTARTDGITLEYNPEFVNSLTPDLTKALWAHEIGHIVYLHQFRHKKKDLDRWNRACDYVVNEMIEKAGFKLKEQWLRHTAFDGKSTEEVYKLLPKMPNQNGQNGYTVSNGNGGTKQSDTSQDPGCVKKPKSPSGQQELSKSEQTKMEQGWKKTVKQAAAYAKNAGRLPGHLAKEIESINKEKVSWREVLFNFLADRVKGDSSWRMPNRRYLPIGVYLPSNESNHDLIKGACYTDASGSVGMSDLNLFAGEMTSIIETFPSIALSSRYFDTKVSKTQDEFTADNLPVTMRPEEVGGGTDFRCVFKDIDDNREGLKFVIVFTDLYCSRFPDPPPPYPVLWAATNKGYGDPPFGDVLRLYDEPAD